MNINIEADWVWSSQGQAWVRWGLWGHRDTILDIGENAEYCLYWCWPTDIHPTWNIWNIRRLTPDCSSVSAQPRVYESWDVINFVLCPLYLYFICGCGTCREPIYWVTGCRHSVPADNGSPNQFYFFMTNLDKCKAKKYQISNILCWRLLLKPHHRLTCL